jgi:uncharacterized protein (DUF885 family)
MKFWVLFVALFLSACSHTPSDKPTGENEKLNDLLARHWDENMERYPEWSTWVNYKGGIYNDRWSETSLEAVDKNKAFTKRQFKELNEIDSTKLKGKWKHYFDLYHADMKRDIEGFKFPGHYLVMNQLGGFQQGIANMLSRMPTRTKKDYENILARLDKAPQKIEGNLLFLKEGLKRGITPPKVTLSDVPRQFDAMLEKDFKKNPLVKPFQKYPKEFDEKLKKEYTARAKKMLAKVIPVFAKAKKYVKDVYIPNCRKNIAFSSMPNGSEWYNHSIKSYTTLDKKADNIHQLGLSEVKRIKAKMKKVMAQVKYKGSFKKFLKYLRTDRKFYYKKKENLLKDYRAISKIADGRLLRVFKNLPRTPYGVEPTPAYMEKSAPTAYYYRGNIEAGKPGIFYANTYDLKSRPKWEMVPLTLHEAMPGHHLQIMIAVEQEAKPELLKFGGYTGYIEGWGLYAESLGEDMEMYEDPYDKFGQLTYEMWRAIRLVVDTGMHAKGWTRKQAIQFFLDNAPKTKHDVTVEVDRYIIWPGQALSYKLGELKIKELRNYAKAQLGEKFDIREYHHQVLKDGAVPLGLLDSNIKNWVKTQK